MTNEGEKAKGARSLAICSLVYIAASASLAWYAWSVQEWQTGDPTGENQFLQIPITSQITFLLEVLLLMLCALIVAHGWCRTLGGRIRLRFSVRALILVVATIAVYFGAWGITKKYGETRSTSSQFDELSPMPFVITKFEFDRIGTTDVQRRRAYLWFFGQEIKTSITSSWTPIVFGG